MNILIKSSKSISFFAGKQEVIYGSHYRPSIYISLVDVDGVTVACNRFTRCLCVVNETEKEFLTNGAWASEESAELIKENFLVPDDFDEYKLCSETRALMSAIPPSAARRHYVIMTTSDCNARCFYCYQLGRKASRIPMSESCANTVADYIIENTIDGGVVTIQWHGGEPLYNDKVIDIICTRLKESNIDYKTSMISNGYLFSEDVVKKAVELWKLERVQIPFDGTKDVYNKVKAYIYRDDSNPFATVINNVKNLLDKGVRVAARVNFDKHNREDIFNLTNYFYESFGKYENFGIYSDILYEDAGAKMLHGTEDKMSLVDTMVEFENYCFDIGLNVARKYSNEFKVRRCMADTETSVVISPDGRLGKCDHCTDSHHFGSVFSKEYDKAMFESFKEQLNNDQDCHACPNFPECVRLKKCPDDGPPYCDDAYKKKKMHRHIMSVKSAYRRIMKAQRENKNDI